MIAEKEIDPELSSLLEGQGLTPTKAAAEAGMSRITVAKIFRGEPVKASTLGKLKNALLEKGYFVDNLTRKSLGGLSRSNANDQSRVVRLSDRVTECFNFAEATRELLDEFVLLAVHEPNKLDVSEMTLLHIEIDEQLAKIKKILQLCENGGKLM